MVQKKRIFIIAHPGAGKGLLAKNFSISSDNGDIDFHVERIIKAMN